MFEIINNLDINFGINTTLHMLILFSFLSAFFVFYVSRLSQQVLSDELEHTIHNGIVKSGKDLSFEVKQSIGALPLDVLQNIYADEEKAMVVNNNWVYRIIVAINFLLWVIFAVVLMSLMGRCGEDIHIWNILIENIVLFTMIGITEFVFFKYIALKYIPVEPSYISKEFIDKLKQSI